MHYDIYLCQCINMNVLSYDALEVNNTDEDFDTKGTRNRI